MTRKQEVKEQDIISGKLKEEQHRKETSVKWFSRVAFVILGIGVLSLALMGYWSSQSGDDALVIKKQPIPIRTIRSEAHPRGVVILEYDYCKNTKSEGEIRTSYVSTHSAEIFLPRAIDRTDPMCGQLEAPYIIPPQVTPGRYHLHFRASYKINPIKTVIIEWDSEEFNVAK